MTIYSIGKRILPVLAKYSPIYRIVESVPLVDHHAGHLLLKLKRAAV